MLVVGEALVIAGLRLLYPRITRRGLLFGVYVGEECWGGEEARRIARSWQSGMVLWSPVSAGLGIAFFLKYRTPLRNVSFAAPKVHSELPAKPAAWSRYACLTGQPARRNAPPGQAARCWASCPFNTVSRPATRCLPRVFPHVPPGFLPLSLLLPDRNAYNSRLQSGGSVLGRGRPMHPATGIFRGHFGSTTAQTCATVPAAREAIPYHISHQASRSVPSRGCRSSNPG